MSAERNQAWIRLVEQKGETTIIIDAGIDESGTLVVTGQDIGAAPKEMFGEADYEYSLEFPEEEKDRLLLALIEHSFTGNSQVISEMMDLAREKGIPWKFHTF